LGIKRLVKLIIFLSIDFLILISKKSRNSSSAIIIVRVDAIGDFILWLESARVLRHHYSQKKITLICNLSVVELATNLNFFNKVIGVDVTRLQSNPLYRFLKFWEISNLSAEVVLQPTYSRILLTGDSIVRLLCAKQRIGSFGDFSNMLPLEKKISNKWYSDLIPSNDTLMHELDRNIEFMRGLGIILSESKMIKLTTFPKINSFNLPKENYFIIFPGASSIMKMWPIENFITISEHIYTLKQWTLLICGSTKEAVLASKLEENYRGKSIDLTGKTSLTELVETIQNAKLLISNDTSAIHIAAAVGTKSLCITGGGHFGRFLPYPEVSNLVNPITIFEKMECFGCNWNCIKEHSKNECMPCIKEVKVSSVISELDTLII